MLSRSELAALNLEEARRLRAAGSTYRQVRTRLGISAGQLGHLRRALKREKAAATRLRSMAPDASNRELPVARSALPAGLRKSLTAAGYRTLGDLADAFAGDASSGLEAVPGIGRHRSALVKRLLDQFRLLPGSADLQAEIEALFPDLVAGAGGTGDRADPIVKTTPPTAAPR